MPQRMTKLNTEIVTEAAKAAPPVAVTATAMAGGLSLNNVIGAATLIYIVLQAGYLVWKWRRDIRIDRRKRREAGLCEDV